MDKPLTDKRTRKQTTHERIVETASRAIRRGGFQGVGVADIMKEAGLTHGGFYAHFSSRDALLAEALVHRREGAGDDAVLDAGSDGPFGIERRIARAQAAGASALRALVEAYLSDRHLVAIETGCPVAALASEMPRQAPEVRAAAARRVRGLIALVERALPFGSPADSAVAIASQLVGALQLARALGDNDEGRAVLAASRRALSVQEPDDR